MSICGIPDEDIPFLEMPGTPKDPPPLSDSNESVQVASITGPGAPISSSFSGSTDELSISSGDEESSLGVSLLQVSLVPAPLKPVSSLCSSLAELPSEAAWSHPPPDAQVGAMSPADADALLQAMVWHSVHGHQLGCPPFPISIEAGLQPGENTDALCLGAMARAVECAVNGRQFMAPLPFLHSLPLHESTQAHLPRLGGPFPDLSSIPRGAVAHLYTDGSCQDSCGGWAVAIFLAVPAEKWFFQGVLSAPTRACIFRETKHTSDEAESSAIAAALSWSLSLPYWVPVQMHIDCDSARAFASGTWFPQTSPDGNLSTAGVSRALMLLLESLGRQVHLVPVRGHCGHPWNELADVAAKAGCLATAPEDPCWPEWWSFLHSPFLEWAWLLPLSSWHWSMPSVFALASGCAHVSSPSLSSAKRSLDALYAPSQSASLPSGALSLHFQAASVNVLTLRDSGTDGDAAQAALRAPGMQELLQDQCAALQLHIIGLQETRLSASVAFRTKHFLVTSASCDSAGQGGCALWTCLSLPYGTSESGRPLFSEPKHVHALKADPHLLIVRIQAPGLQLLVVVGHGPHSRRAEAERRLWWDGLHSSLASLVNPSEDLLFLVDANARVGSHCSPFIGPDGAEKESPNGTLFHEFLQSWRLCLPATLGKHSGDHRTWTSPQGTQSRLDFIAVPLTWLPSVVRTQVMPDIDLGHARADHFLTLLQFQGSREAAPFMAAHAPFRPTVPDSAKIGIWTQGLISGAPCSWGTDVDAHVHFLTRQHQRLMRQSQRARSDCPRQPYVTVQALALVRFRKHLRDQIRHLQAEVDRDLLRRVFHSLRRDSRSDVKRTPLREQPHCRLACAIRAFALSAVKLKQALRQGKRAYLTTLAANFQEEARGRNWHALWKALSCLHPNKGKKRALRPLLSVRAADGHVLQNQAEVSRRWSEHFASIEGGELSTFSELAASHERLAASSRATPALRELLTRQQWEFTFRGLSAGKAPGADGLSSDFARVAPALLAANTYSLGLKVAYTGCEPVRWRGGTACPLYKGKYEATLCSSFRSILVSELLSKRFHSWMRSGMLDAFAQCRTQAQCGVQGGHTTSMLSLWVRTVQHHLRDRKVSHGVFFTDIVSAFYTTLREFVQQKPDAGVFVAWCRSKGMTDDTIDVIIAALLQETAKLPELLTSCQLDRLRDILSATWFVVSGSTIPRGHWQRDQTRGPPGGSLVCLRYVRSVERHRGKAYSSRPGTSSAFSRSHVGCSTCRCCLSAFCLLARRCGLCLLPGPCLWAATSCCRRLSRGLVRLPL